jgi:hypothetical protein
LPFDPWTLPTPIQFHAYGVMPAAAKDVRRARDPSKRVQYIAAHKFLSARLEL